VQQQRGERNPGMAGEGEAEGERRERDDGQQQFGERTGAGCAGRDEIR